MSIKIGSIQPLGPIPPAHLDSDRRIGVYLASDHGVPVVELTAEPCVLSVSDAECLVQLLNLAILRARDPRPRRAYEPPKLAPLTPGDPRAKRLAEAILRGQAAPRCPCGAFLRIGGHDCPYCGHVQGSGGDEPPVSAPSAPSDTEPAPAPEPDPLPSEATAPLPPLAGSEATPPCPKKHSHGATLGDGWVFAGCQCTCVWCDRPPRDRVFPLR